MPTIEVGHCDNARPDQAAEEQVRRTAGWIAVALVALTTSCSRSGHAVSTSTQSSAPASTEPSSTTNPPSAFGAVTPVPVASGASTHASTAEPKPARIGTIAALGWSRRDHDTGYASVVFARHPRIRAVA